MDSDLGRSVGVVAAARLSTGSLVAHPAASSDVLAIAAHLRGIAGPAGPFTGRAALSKVFDELSDADLTTLLERADPREWGSWPRRDLTFALVTLIRRLAAANPRARRSGITLLAPLADIRPTEVMNALESVLRAADVPDAGLVALIRSLRKAMGAPQAPHAPRGRTRRPGHQPPTDVPKTGRRVVRLPRTGDLLTLRMVTVRKWAGGSRDRWPVIGRGSATASRTLARLGKLVKDHPALVYEAEAVEAESGLTEGPVKRLDQAGPGEFGTGEGGGRDVGGGKGRRGPRGARPAKSAAGSPPADPVPSSSAYPVVKVTGPGGRRGVAVVGTPFTISIGIGAKAVGTMARTTVEIPSDVATLTVRLLYDPDSFTVPDDAPTELPTAPDAPPLVVTMTPVEDDDLNQLRRVGVAYFAGSQLVGLAWATVFVLPDLASAQVAQVPPAPNLRMLDLSVLQQPDPPDLVLAVTYGDDAAVDRLVWTAFAGPEGPAVPDDGPQREDTATSADIAAFAQNLRTFVATEKAEDRVYLQLAGSAPKIAARISTAVQEALRTLVGAADAAHRSPPTVLLVSEELSIPWELADIGLSSLAGGSSPFLGAHVAISRWPLDVTDPPRAMLQVKSVTSMATVADEFTGVKDLAPLSHAPGEARNLAEHYPPVTPVPADWTSLKALLSGDPSVDLIHLAVHGNFDPTGIGSGIYVIKSTTATTLGQTVEGARLPDLVTPEQIAVLTRTTTPFVFVNACQAGAAKPVLGDSSGIATSLLASGACGVVVSIWNVNDAVAATVATDFYRAVFDDRVGVGEALRRIRARYTRDAAGVQEMITSTLIGYQSFGHPGLRLAR